MKKFFILSIIFFLTNLLYSQEIGTDYLWQLSPEITLKAKKFEFRFRPQERIILNNDKLDSRTTFGRTDLMAGFSYKKFKFFVYSRYDTRKQLYIGPRIDFNTTAFNKKLLNPKPHDCPGIFNPFKTRKQQTKLTTQSTSTRVA